MHRERLLLVGLGSVTVALFLVLWHATRLAPDTVAPPQSLQDVALRADVLGLHHRSDVLSGKVGDRLVVSDQALTFDRVSALRFGEIAHPCWQGTVAACVPWRSYLNYAHPDHGVVWGRTFLFGDPARPVNLDRLVDDLDLADLEYAHHIVRAQGLVLAAIEDGNWCERHQIAQQGDRVLANNQAEQRVWRRAQGSRLLENI